MKTNQVLKIDAIPAGPNISGTVTVPLSELDKMRVDHANLKKLCESLMQTQMKVICVVEERRNIIRYGGWDGMTRIPDVEYKELSVEYRNLDDVREDIRKRMLDEELIKSEKLSKELEEVKLKLSDRTTAFDIAEIANDKLNKEIEQKNKELEDVRGILDGYDKQIEGYKESIEKLNAEVERLKLKKSFWSFLN
jgi:DNA repair exonuclease SbcCD ATPase subunit